jgi:nitrile hydratase
VDEQFRERLLADGNAVREVLGFDMTDGFLPDLVLRVVESTETEHHVIVCTLCSCYPVAVLGPPPAWYKSEAYRSRVVIEPRAVLKEFGVTLPSEKRVTVWDSTSEIRYMVLPERPRGTEGWSEEQLADLVTPESIVGTGLVTAPTDAPR